MAAALRKKRRACATAFAMGTHARIGKNSSLAILEMNILNHIWNFVKWPETFNSFCSHCKNRVEMNICFICGRRSCTVCRTFVFAMNGGALIQYNGFFYERTPFYICPGCGTARCKHCKWACQKCERLICCENLKEICRCDICKANYCRDCEKKSMAEKNEQALSCCSNPCRKVNTRREWVQNFGTLKARAKRRKV
jgi:hypothetical protein